MPRIAYVNGRYLSYPDASISIDDRALQFGDSVYEVVAVRGGKLVELEDHLARLERSLRELRIEPPLSQAPLLVVIDQIQRRNHVRDGLIYVQVTRGIAPRAHKFPKGPLRGSLIVTGKQRVTDDTSENLRKGIRVITLPDGRWYRRDIKSTNLLANVLAKQSAIEAGAVEAWLLDEHNCITEGTSSTAWIVTDAGCVVTRPLSHDILPGVTRLNLINVLKTEKLVFEERPFTLAEAETAKEAFITSASNPVTPVIQVNQTILGDGAPGLITKLLQKCYHATPGV